jgi:hypothetical protein
VLVTNIDFVFATFYRELIASVLEYDSVCFTGRVRAQLKGLERLQYRGIRILIGLMRSIPNNSLEVLGGIPPLEHRMLYLNYRYLVSTFQKVGHPRSRLELLYMLNPKKCLTTFREVADLGFVHDVPS